MVVWSCAVLSVRGEAFRFAKRIKRAFFCYFSPLRKVIKSGVLALLFRLYEKVTKKYTRGLLTSGLPGYGSKLYTGML